MLPVRIYLFPNTIHENIYFFYKEDAEISETILDSLEESFNNKKNKRVNNVFSLISLLAR